MFDNYVGHMWFISDKTVAVKIYFCLHKNIDKKILLKNTDMIYRIMSLFSIQHYVIYVPSQSVFFVISPWSLSPCYKKPLTRKTGHFWKMACHLFGRE